MRFPPLLPALLVAALAQPALAATGEREAQVSPAATPGGASAPAVEGGSTAPGAVPPREQRQSPAQSQSQGQYRGQGQSQDQDQEKPASAYEPDNTGRNRQHDSRIEAEDQSNNSADVAAVAAIRRALTDDPNLSLHAHNVKIIIEGGRVILRGPVKGEAEKRKVESIARRSAGNRQVVNELEATSR